MNSLNEYNESIRKDIALEFGLEAGGYSPRPNYTLTIRQCAELNDKYGFDKARVIAKRYASLKKVGNK